MRITDFPTKRVEIITGTEGFRLINGQVVSPRSKTIVTATTREILGALKKGIIVNEVLDSGTRVRLNLQNYKTDFSTPITPVAPKKEETTAPKVTMKAAPAPVATTEEKKENTAPTKTINTGKYKNAENSTTETAGTTESKDSSKK